MYFSGILVVHVFHIRYNISRRTRRKICWYQVGHCSFFRGTRCPRLWISSTLSWLGSVRCMGVTVAVLGYDVMLIDVVTETNETRTLDDSCGFNYSTKLLLCTEIIAIIVNQHNNQLQQLVPLVKLPVSLLGYSYGWRCCRYKTKWIVI